MSLRPDKEPVVDRNGTGQPDAKQAANLTSLLDVYGTFRLNFHHFDRFELDLRRHIHVRGAAFSCLRLKLADMVLI